MISSVGKFVRKHGAKACFPLWFGRVLQLWARGEQLVLESSRDAIGVDRLATGPSTLARSLHT